ncbi:glycosyltransferase family 2 protein [Marinoscillum sp. MHG1-6]|uniref:glycosyltransferase family 2 protein n=1 Tax=Marinoscillum sp. MHG1-6 TaxID=2959627 RepID=UPI0021581608|nr:glycosyltransferase family 2 protein [Marinoscillum sp. MHG1-6]
MNNPMPSLSIITACYNAEEFIEPTLSSIDQQICSDFEHIIIDGNSTDSTLSIISNHKAPYRTVTSAPDDGVYDAMNKGFKMAQGEYVLFLNAGDELADSSTLDKIFSTKVDADIIYGETLIMNQNREVLGTRTELTSRRLPKHLCKNDFLNGQVVSHQSFIAKKSLCNEYDLKYSCSSDINWMLEIISRTSSIKNTNLAISKYLQGGISDRQLATCWKERFSILCKHFSIPLVIWQHLKFALRFLKMGAYRKS